MSDRRSVVRCDQSMVCIQRGLSVVAANVVEDAGIGFDPIRNGLQHERASKKYPRISGQFQVVERNEGEGRAAIIYEGRDIIGIMSSPGVYVFERNGRVAYVGRSDSDIDARIGDSYRAGKYDLKRTILRRSSAMQAYRTECRLYHRHNPCDNDRHPAVPTGANWRCPVKGCRWS
jgi:hypothetical protein